MSWLSPPSLNLSRQAQLTTTALLSGAVVAGMIFSFQAAQRRLKVDDLKRSIPDTGADHHASKLTDLGAASPVARATKEDERSAALALRARQGDYDDELILEQLARNRVFLTDDGLAKLRSAFVIVVGCGGVGSHAAAALARSGVSKIRLIDFDQVTLSSLNRHAVATLADVGTPKVTCISKRMEQISPWVDFDCRNELFREEAAERLLGPWPSDETLPPAYIIDAIDNIDSKVALLSYCHARSLRIISSMGAGCKSDPTRILLGDISTSIEDPLSRSTRRRLRLRGIDRDIPVIFSTEKPSEGKASLLPLPDDEYAKGSVGDLGVLPDFRVRILPVLGTMPAVFGLVAANHVIVQIAGYPHDPLPFKARDKMHDAILAALQAQEQRLVRMLQGVDPVGLRIPVSREDVGYLVEEVFRGRSVVSGVPTRLALVRWQMSDRDGGDEHEGSKGMVDTSVPGQKVSRLRLGELVCMTKEEAAVHEQEVLIKRRRPEEVYEAEVVALVRRRMDEERGFEAYR
ncbi:MAG: hypothetical protein M1817_000876 [Caeruleum heppii]|nr:MAG: hypothetical protein M1817_000876 [Caeruleum heppii]